MSLNDPRWGNNQGNDDEKPDNRRRGDTQGPPDLEDVWKDFNQKLQGIFGGKRSGGNPGGGRGNGGGGQQLPQFSPKQFGGGVGVILVLLAAFWLASGFYIVNANERGVVLRFGEFVETTEPGLRWRLPYPIETHESVDLSGVRTVEIGYRGTERNKVLREALMLTDDANIINIQFAVQYVLKNPEDYLFKNRQPDESVTQAAESAIREVVGKSRMDFVLYEGREEIAANTQRLTQEILDRYETGILISRITMQNAQPPEQVQAAFDDAVKAGQDRERQRNEGEAYANNVVPRARGAAARMLEEANAYRERVVADAEGEASRFNQIYTEYSRAPEVTRQRLYLEALQRVYANSNKVFVDAEGGNNLMMLPLDKMIQGAGMSIASGNNASSPPVSVQPQRPAEPVLDPRDRDAMRNRDMGVR